jgi:hypothetical protein
VPPFFFSPWNMQLNSRMLWWNTSKWCALSHVPPRAGHATVCRPRHRSYSTHNASSDARFSSSKSNFITGEHQHVLHCYVTDPLYITIFTSQVHRRLSRSTAAGLLSNDDDMAEVLDVDDLLLMMRTWCRCSTPPAFPRRRSDRHQQHEVERRHDTIRRRFYFLFYFFN